MRILSVGNFGSSWDGSICDEIHVADALEMFGVEVTRCQRGEGFPGGEYDLTLVSQWDGYPEGYIEGLPRPIVYWAFDVQEDNQPWHKRLVDACDLFLSPEFKPLEKHRWLPQAFAPMFLDKKNVFKEYDVLFTGTYLPQCTFRTEVLKAVDEKFKLHVCSVTQNEWKEQGLKDVNPPVLDKDLPLLIGKAKINLSVDLFPERPGCWSDRNAQVMACGGFVLYKYAPMSEEEFGAGVVYFNTVEDCLRKIELYLNNDEARNHIASVGYSIAHARLTAVERVRNLLTIIEMYR